MLNIDVCLIANVEDTLVDRSLIVDLIGMSAIRSALSYIPSRTCQQRTVMVDPPRFELHNSEREQW